MKKSIFLFFAAILCAMTANAYNQSAVDLYFDNSEAKWNSCYVYIGHSTWTSVYPLTRVSGTQYLWKLAKADFNGGGTWNGATGWVLCYEKWWDSKAETIDKYTWHGAKNVTQKTGSAWVDSKIYKTNGTASTTSDGNTIQAYKVTSYTKNNYTVTINTPTGGTLTVKDYDDQAVATGASKIHLTVLKFSATPADGYVLDAVEINDGTNTTTIAAADLATKTHTLTSNVTINPVWRATTSTVTVTATATNGSVTGGGVVEEGTSVTLTATPADGYKFVNWTVGGAEVSTANPYIFTAEEDVTVVANFEELPKTTVYFVNTPGWTNVKAYAYSPANASWPGVDATLEAEKIGDFDVYSYTATEGKYANVIFNGNSGQTADLTWTDGKYYIHQYNSNTDWYTKAEAEALLVVPVVTYDYYIAGPLAGGWSATQMGMEKVAEGQYACEFTKDAGDYQFKVTNGKWGNETGGFDCADVEGSYKEVSHVDGNVNVKLTATTTFTVKFDSNTKKITFEGLTTAAPAPTYDYYIAGPLAGGWNATQMGMEKVAEGQYTCEFTKDAGDYQFKVTNGKWGNETGGFDCADVEGSYKEVSNVDGNVNVKLTATTTFTVKFDSNTKKISFEGLTPAETKYYIAGTENLTGYNWKEDGLQLTKDGDLYKHTFSALPAGVFEFKVTNGTWSNPWGYSNLGAAYEEVSEGTDGEGNPNDNIKFVTEEAKNITVIFDPATGKITIDGLTEKAPVVSTYALMGVNGDWTTGITMTVNPDNADEYVLKAQSISSTDAIKVLETAGSTQTWHNTVDAYSNATYTLVDDGFGGKNIVLPEGTYNFYFKKINNEIYIEEVYVRDVTNTYGTICLPYASNSYDGAIFYRVAGKETGKVYLESVSALEAGVPYIFEKTASKIVVARNGDPVATAGNANGLVGTFTNETEVAAGNYILLNNELRKSDGTAKVNANRAYLDMEDIVGGQPTQLPGRRYIGMSVQGENEATGFENITAPADKAVKAIVNGQLIIIRDGEMYNAQGVRL